MTTHALTIGTFGSLPDLDDDEIEAQIAYALRNGWAVSVEFTDDPHPRNTYWELWDLPMFDLTDPRGALREVEACREAHPTCYVQVTAFDNSKGRETIALRFLAHRPGTEPGFRLDRGARGGRTLAYQLHAYSADSPHGARYG